MGVPSQSEHCALEEAGPLIRFAAERVKDLDPGLTLVIADSLEAAKNETWTPQVSQAFWAAFNRLCLLIQPTTMDCLATANRRVSSFSPVDLKKITVSHAELTSQRYLWTLFVTLLVALPLQLYAWAGTIESKKVEDLLTKNQPMATALRQNYYQLVTDAASSNKDDNNSALPPELNKRADQIRSDSASLALETARLRDQASILQSLTAMKVVFPPDPPPAVNPNWDEVYLHANERFERVTLSAVKAQEEAGLVVGLVLSFILPLLFGLMGAIAYIVRSISNEISATTFSPTTPIRHLIRLTLGALAGVVVGFFTNVTTQIALSPLAIAFLAGYGVEPLFSMFDGFIAKFKA